MEQWLAALEGILGKGAGEPPVGQLDLFAGLDEILDSNEQIRFNSGTVNFPIRSGCATEAAVRSPAFCVIHPATSSHGARIS